MPVAELCREYGMSDASFYKWRAKYGGMDASMVSRSELCPPLVRGQWRARWNEADQKTVWETVFPPNENRRLKRMYADLSMQNDLLNSEGERHWFQRT